MIFTIAGKELRSMFTSPLAWVVLAIVQLVLALIFLARVDFFLLNQAEIARVPNYPGLTQIAIVPMFGFCLDRLVDVGAVIDNAAGLRRAPQSDHGASDGGAHLDE